jgi:hypothetical protein
MSTSCQPKEPARRDVTETTNIHESHTAGDPARPGSSRSFGIVMALALFLIAALSWWRDGHAWPWMAPAAVAFFVAALLRPSVLDPLNQYWFKLGIVLHAITSPAIMALIYFGAVWPTGLVLRMMKKGPLELERQPERESYWIYRVPPGPAPDTMKDQF